MDFLTQHLDIYSLLIPTVIALLPPVNRFLDILTSDRYGKIGFEIMDALADGKVTEEEVKQLLRKRD